MSFGQKAKHTLTLKSMHNRGDGLQFLYSFKIRFGMLKNQSRFDVTPEQIVHITSSLHNV